MQAAIKSQPGYKNGQPIEFALTDYWIIKLANSDSLITRDEDRDGLNDYAELVQGTDPRNFDTNVDYLADGVNVFTGLPPLNTDTRPLQNSRLQFLSNKMRSNIISKSD